MNNLKLLWITSLLSCIAWAYFAAPSNIQGVCIILSTCIYTVCDLFSKNSEILGGKTK